MDQNDHRSQLLADLNSTSDVAIVEAAKGLLGLGEYGDPPGVYLLLGGKAALRLWRLADASVLLYHGLRVAEPSTMLWAEMLVNRASACAQFGLYHDAIKAGEQFLEAIEAIPEARKWLPYVYHAIGFSCDRLKRHTEAAEHFRMAAQLYADPVQRAIATTDHACALTFSGLAEEAGIVLAQVPQVEDTYANFVLAGTTAIVLYHQGRHSEAVAAGEQAEVLSQDNQEEWALNLAEVRYWASKAAWEIGDRYRAALWALQAAVVAEQRYELALRNAATDWLLEIRRRGGIRSA